MATLSRSSMLTFVVSRTRLGDSLFNLVQFSGLINHPFSAGPFAREQRQHLSSREHIVPLNVTICLMMMCKGHEKRVPSAYIRDSRVQFDCDQMQTGYFL